MLMAGEKKEDSIPCPAGAVTKKEKEKLPQEYNFGLSEKLVEIQ